MAKLYILVLSIAFSVTFTFCAYLSDGVYLVHFKKIKDEFGIYNFEYETNDGKIVHGKTINLVRSEDLHLQLLFDEADVVYWVEFTNDEFVNATSLSKMVRLVKRSEDLITMRDDFVEYSLTISTGLMYRYPYQTTWDLDQICFIRHIDGHPTFNYTMTATNNSRKYNGTTSIESDDPLVQLIHQHDGDQRNDIYQVIFTSEQLNSDKVFCRGITKVISVQGVLGASPIENIDPIALKSLVG